MPAKLTVQQRIDPISLDWAELTTCSTCPKISKTRRVRGEGGLLNRFLHDTESDGAVNLLPPNRTAMLCPAAFYILLNEVQYARLHEQDRIR